jgi:transcriptional regulator with XRE-family HTH domain
MKRSKRTRLQAAGGRFGTVKGFLKLTPEAATLIEVKQALARQVRERRLARRLTQAALAHRLGSSQSRVAKLEAGDPAVSVDLLLRSLFALGATPRDVGSALRRRRLAGRPTIRGVRAADLAGLRAADAEARGMAFPMP